MQIPSLGTTYKLVWSDAAITLGCPCHTSEYVIPQNASTWSSPNTASLTATNMKKYPTKAKIPWCPISPKLAFFCKTHHMGTLQRKLGILICLKGQYLSSTYNVSLSPKQSPNIKILFKCDMSIGSQSRITVAGDWGFTDTLQGYYVFQATFKNR